MQRLFGHTEVLPGTGASALKDQLGVLFPNKKNLLPYFIILTGLSTLHCCLLELEEFHAD